LFAEVVEHAVSTQERIGIDAVSGDLNDLLEMRDMLAARIKEWQDQIKVETLAELLSKLLRRRFGDLPPDTTKRIRSAKVEELDEWLDRVLDAASIADVFDNKQTN
jgi:hypothetical protein